MPDVTISDLSNLTPAGTSVIPISNGITTGKTTINQVVSLAPVTYSYSFNVSISRPNSTWAAAAAGDPSGFQYSIPGGTAFYRFINSTQSGDTITGTNPIEDVNFTAPYNCSLSFKTLSYFNQNGPNCYITSPVLVCVGFDYSTNNGTSWIRPNGSYSFTYGVDGGDFNFINGYSPVINSGGNAAGGATTVMTTGQTIKFRPKWKIYVHNSEANCTQVTSIGGGGIFEVSIRPI